MSDFDQWKQSDPNVPESTENSANTDTETNSKKIDAMQGCTPKYSYDNDVTMGQGTAPKEQEESVSGTYCNEDSHNYTIENYGQPIGTGNGKKRKGRKLLIAAITIIAILVGGVGGTFIFARAEIMNLLALYTKSDLEYFKQVERKNFERAIDNNRETDENNKEIQNNLFQDGNTQKLDMNLKFGEDFKKNHGIESLADMKVTSTSTFKDNKLDSIIGLLYNNTEIIKYLISNNMDTGSLFLSMPDLKEGVIDLSSILSDSEQGFTSMMNSSLDEITKLNTNDIAANLDTTILESYFNYFIDSVQDVTVQKGQEIIVNDVKANCTEVTVNISGEESVKILKGLLLKLKEDKILTDKSITINKESIEESIDSLLEYLNDISPEEAKSLKFTMTDYVGGKGQILGRQFKFGIGAQSASFQYVTILDENQSNTKIIVRVMGVTLFEYKGVHIEDADKNNGTIQLSFPLAMLVGSMDYDFKFNINYETINSTKEKYNSTITIQPECSENIKIPDTDIKLNDYSLKLVVSAESKELEAESNIDFILMEKNKEAMSIGLVNKMTPYSEIERISPENSTIYNEQNIEQYLTEEELYNYLVELDEKVNNELFTNIVSAFIYDSGYDQLDDSYNSDVWEINEDEMGIDTEKDYYFSSSHLANYIDVTTYEGIEIETELATDPSEIEYEKNKMYEALMSEIIKTALIMEIPVEEVEIAKKKFMEYIEGIAEMAGIDLGEYLNMLVEKEDPTKEEVDDAVENYALKELYKKMVVAYFVDKDDVYLTGEELKQGAKTLFENKYFVFSLEDLKEYYHLEEADLVDEVITSKVMEKLLEKSIIKYK